MAAAKIISTEILWQQVSAELSVGVDPVSSGVVALRGMGSELSFDEPTKVLVTMGGAEQDGWVPAPGNNLIGARSTVVIGAEELELSAPVHAIRDFDGGFETLREVAGLQISESWTLIEARTFERRLRISWSDQDSTGPIREVLMLAPGFSDLPSTETKFLAMAAPAHWQHPFVNVSLVRDLTSSNSVAATVPLMADVGSAAMGIRNGSRELLCGLADLRFPAKVDLVKVETSLFVGHRIQAACLTSRPGEIELGPQLITFSSSVEEFGAGFRHQLTSIVEIPKWLSGATIYEVHIGNKFPDPFAPNDFEGKNPYPNANALVADLDRIKALGFDVVQLMPLFPFPGYTINSYFDVAGQYGGEQALRLLAQQLQERNMKLVVDFILHGPVDSEIRAYAEWAVERSEYLDYHRNWFMQDESGEIRRTHTYSLDLANQEVQQHMSDAMLELLRLGVSGFRVDAPLWNMFPNWDPTISYPAGHSTMGWVALMHQVRHRAEALGLECALIGETAGIAGASVFDCFYGYEEMGLLRGFVPSGQPFLALALDSDAKFSAREIRNWLAEKATLMGSGFSRTIRHLDSHDSYEWGSLSTVASRLFGAAFPALTASFGTLPGPWMHFCGAEQGVEELVTQLNRWRRHPAVADGEVDFAASDSPNQNLFHFVSQSGDSYHMLLANLSPNALEGKLTLEAEVAKALAGALEQDASLQMRQNDCQVTIEPWGFRVYQTPFTFEGVAL